MRRSDAATRKPVFLGWGVVAVAALASFTEVSFFNPVLGVFMPALTEDFGWGRTEVSGAMTTGSLLGALLSPWFGPLIDRYGGRRFVAGGAFVMFLCLVALAMLQNVWQFYIFYSIGRGMASGIVGLAATVTVSKWFVRRRGLAVGLTTLGTRAGFAIMPIGVQLIIGGWGWREAWLALAAIVLVLGILPAVRFLHPRPEALGLLPDGDSAAAPRGGDGKRFASEVSWTRDAAVRTKAFWLVTAAISLQAWAGGAINMHQIPHLVDQGLSPESAALIISLLALFAAAGSLLEGVLDERIGARWTLVIGLVGSAGGMVVLMNVHGTDMALAYAAAYGVAFGLMVTSSQVVFADYFGREAIGAIRGAAAPIQMGLNAIGPVVAGAAYDLTGNYLAAFIPFTAAYLLAAASLVAARKPVVPERLAIETAGAVAAG
ncbi:MAG TPA: MFS transporter [Dehalococcoidia bacterium]|nr:MFS transporter [Dehalococcoidia bacterium]